MPKGAGKKSFFLGGGRFFCTINYREKQIFGQFCFGENFGLIFGQFFRGNELLSKNFRDKFRLNFRRCTNACAYAYIL